MQPAARDQAARWFAEATETGNALAPLPPELTPRSVTDGCRIATLVLDRLDYTPCGVRMGSLADGRGVPGPMLEPRLLQDGATVPLAALRHCRVAPAVVGVLAEDLPRRGEELPNFSALHPALDFSAWRLREEPAAAALAAADFGGLGLTVLGAARRMAPPSNARVGLQGGSILVQDIATALLQAATAARRVGGLPAGALLQVVFGPGRMPKPGETLVAQLGRLGRASGSCA